MEWEGTVYCEKFVMIALTTDAENNIKKTRANNTPLTLYYVYVYVYV